jgi:acetolactate synthase-1/2/3 large subunit
MRMGRPGPVHFDMPYDLYMRTAAVSTPEPSVHGSPLNWRTTVADETVEKALALLTSAQRPLILAGGGVRVGRAYDELKSLAEQLDIPVYTSFMGKGALPADHRLHLGVAGVWGEYPATEAVRNADVILAIGARFNDLHTGSWIPGYVYNIPPTRLIQVDIDPEETGRSRSAWSATPRPSSLRRCGSRAPKVCAAAMADHGTRRSKPGARIGAITANRSSARARCRSSRAA